MLRLAILTVILLGTPGAAQQPSKSEQFFGKEELARQVGLHEKGCKRGDAGECFNLALAYAQGLSVPRDEARAATLYKKACDKGHLDACNNLGVAYVEGVGVKKEPR
ncbi:MAG TPA: tetratricopeptide repeat protein, partial [Archangium sp.]